MSEPRLNLDDVLATDRGRLLTLDKKRRDFARLGKPHEKLDAQLESELAKAIEKKKARKARHCLVSSPLFDDALPISQKRNEIAELIKHNQVVILCGETGSGKTTQLPKICLALGRGMNGLIGCTQPRRIAARSLATRLAHELGSYGNHAVGYKIRFGDHTSPDTLVKVMTDGILLSETHSDRNLAAYDTLIIDEAHERSLNIDFLLGYVKRLMPKRPDLKIIITSATIDPQRFAKHFGLAHVVSAHPNNPIPSPSPVNGGREFVAPIIEVSGRTYPVEIRYRPEHLLDKDDNPLDLDEAVVKAVDELFAETSSGDVLVFLPGEREIRDCAESLRKHHPAHTEILPLFARLSSTEQDRIFQTGGRRRIVLSTNVAETSLTVPGIRYVIDAGVARINRYSSRSKIDLLQIEPISQASAQQRAGRCGRVANGICIRLYSEEDFNARPIFTTPEILRTSLAAVILKMKSMSLGDMEDFPFLEAPIPRMVEDGYRQLFELGAVDSEKQLTPLGTQLAKFPVDPAIARMIIAGEKYACLKEILIIAAALSTQDPRDRPHDKQQEVAVAHEKFADPQSEFLSLLKLWTFFEESWKHKKSNRKFDVQMRENFLSPMRLREWRDVHAQLSELATTHGLHLNSTPTKYESLHRALLSGLLSNVGNKSIEGDHYQGTRAIKFHLPQRGQQYAAQKAGRMKWIVAAELTETTRIYARTVARIEPEWIEELAQHLVTRTYSDPHWERKGGQVVASEQVSLYGLVVNPSKRVHYGAINPVEAREIFIRQGLVPGELDTHGKFLQLNLKLIAEIEDLEAKARRQDVLINEQDLFALYDALIPADIVNAQGFEKWRKDAEKINPKILTFTVEQLMRRTANEITFELFPKNIRLRGAIYPLKYRFEPGHVLDGATLTLPVSVMNQLEPNRFDWLVMGMLRDKVAMLIKSLPQRLRSPLVPVPETVSAFIEHLCRQPNMNDLSAADTPLIDALAKFIRGYKAIEVARDDWNPARLTPHLLMNFCIVDADGKELASGRDFEALREKFKEASKTVFSTLHRNKLERDDILRWDFGDLPETINFERDRIRYDGFPALLDQNDSVAIRVLDQKIIAERAHQQGLARLFMLELPEQVKQLTRSIHVSPVAAFQFSALFPAHKNHALDALRQEIIHAAISKTFLEHDVIREALIFSKLRDNHRAQLAPNAIAITKTIDESLQLIAKIKQFLQDRFIKSWEHVEPDVNLQLAALFGEKFISQTSSTQLAHYPRYLNAILLRLDKFKKGAMERDLEQARSIRPLWQNYLRTRDKLDEKVVAYRWLIEELRVGLFAQELRTALPVSVKRVAKVWEECQ